MPDDQIFSTTEFDFETIVKNADNMHTYSRLRISVINDTEGNTNSMTCILKMVLNHMYNS